MGDKKVYSFRDFLKAQGVFFEKATPEEYEILKQEFCFTYAQFCNKYNYEMEDDFEVLEPHVRSLP